MKKWYYFGLLSVFALIALVSLSPIHTLQAASKDQQNHEESSLYGNNSGAAIFFEHDSYGGWKIVEYPDGNCHNITWWKNDGMSSVITAKNIGYTYIYEHANCKGGALPIPPGMSISSLQRYSWGWNDVASSIRVYPAQYP